MCGDDGCQKPSHSQHRSKVNSNYIHLITNNVCVCVHLFNRPDMEALGIEIDIRPEQKAIDAFPGVEDPQKEEEEEDVSTPWTRRVDIGAAGRLCLIAHEAAPTSPHSPEPRSDRRVVVRKRERRSSSVPIEPPIRRRVCKKARGAQEPPNHAE